MAYQSKTYSLSDEVVEAIEAARAQGETPNQLLRRLLLSPVDLDAVGPELSSKRGKVTTETRRSIREKREGKG